MDNTLKTENIRTFTGHEKVSLFHVGEKLTEFGENQNSVNEALAAALSELSAHVSSLENRLEEKQLKHEEIMKRLASELSALKKDFERLKLSDKLNTSSIKRLNDMINLTNSETSDEE